MLTWKHEIFGEKINEKNAKCIASGIIGIKNMVALPRINSSYCVKAQN